MLPKMELSEAGIEFLKGEEEFTDKLGKDSGHDVIGYGCDLTPAQALQYVGKTITEQEATALLLSRVGNVYTFLELYVTVPLNQNQYDALVSLVYNIGVGNFFKSSIRRLLNTGDYAGAASHFALYDYSVGKKLKGLDVRRAKEAALFMRKD